MPTTNSRRNTLRLDRNIRDEITTELIGAESLEAAAKRIHGDIGALYSKWTEDVSTRHAASLATGFNKFDWQDVRGDEHVRESLTVGEVYACYVEKLMLEVDEEYYETEMTAKARNARLTRITLKFYGITYAKFVS